MKEASQHASDAVKGTRDFYTAADKKRPRLCASAGVITGSLEVAGASLLMINAAGGRWFSL
jgi:hypothetical protein